jgi:hypothetical protein
MGKDNIQSGVITMGQWGLESSAGDSVHDYLQEIQVDTEKFTQKDVDPVIKAVWVDGDTLDKLGVVMHLLTHELTVPRDILVAALKFANDELHPDVLQHWSKGRKEVVQVELNDINYAIENGGKGRARHSAGLFENMAKKLAEPKDIELPCYGIIVTLASDKGGEAITSDMHEACPYCKDPACDMDCPDFMEHCSDRDKEEQQKKQAERYEFLCHRAATDALESIILGHAGAGIDISTPAYIEGIETAWQALANANYEFEPLG